MNGGSGVAGRDEVIRLRGEEIDRLNAVLKRALELAEQAEEHLDDEAIFELVRFLRDPTSGDSGA